MTIYAADGTTLGRSNASSPEVYTSVPQLVTIGVVGVEYSLRDRSNLASALRDYAFNVPDGLELPCVAQWDPDDTTHTAIRDTDAGNETARNWKITFTDSPATTAIIVAKVTRAVVTGIELDNDLMLEFTLKPVQSLPVWS